MKDWYRVQNFDLPNILPHSNRMGNFLHYTIHIILISTITIIMNECGTLWIVSFRWIFLTKNSIWCGIGDMHQFIIAPPVSECLRISREIIHRKQEMFPILQNEKLSTCYKLNVYTHIVIFLSLCFKEKFIQKINLMK